jgi:hypothetical protein
MMNGHSHVATGRRVLIETKVIDEEHEAPTVFYRRPRFLCLVSLGLGRILGERTN